MPRTLTDAKERRNYVRLEKKLTVKLKIDGMRSDKTYTATTKNISHGGICLEVSKDQLELVGKLSAAADWPSIQVAPALPNSNGGGSAEPAWITSRLDWVQPPTPDDSVLRMGMNFVAMSNDVRKRIYHFVVDEFIKKYGV